MNQLQYAILQHRTVITVGGEDRSDFLQALVSNDITKIAPNRTIWAALLTPKGKFLHEFFIFELGDIIGLECEQARSTDLINRLTRYKLRANVTLKLRPDLSVAAVWGDEALDTLGLTSDTGASIPARNSIVFTDPRTAKAGARWILPIDMVDASIVSKGFSLGKTNDYDGLRIRLGLPDGSRDMTIEKAFLLENGFEELNGVDYEKGCYVGQELTARTHYRALIKKCLLPVSFEGTALDPGTPVTTGSEQVGVMKSTVDGIGLAFVRHDALEKPIYASGRKLEPQYQDWIAGNKET